jgi:hypothetical protein
MSALGEGRRAAGIDAARAGPAADPDGGSNVIGGEEAAR